MKLTDRLLSLDVGVTTGYAVLLRDGSILETGAVDVEVLNRTLQDLKALHDPVRIVAERPVIIRGPLGDKLECAMQSVRGMLPDPEFFDPASWKQTPYSKSPCPRGLTEHERDAIRLGRWALKTRLQST